jgi:hypothetical protein
MRIYEINRTPSFFIKGRGLVASAGSNSLVLEHLDGDEIILKYHFVPGLVASPPARLEPVKLDGANLPFIRLVQPPERLEIYMQP